VSTAGRFVGDDHPRQMVKQREEIVQMLQQVGTPKDRIEEIVTPINDMVERDLRSDAWQLIWHQVAELNKTREEGKRLDPEPFRQVIIERYDRAELTRLLKAHGVQVSGLDTQLDAVDNFRRTKQLA
jgi:hypothetical protein